MRQGDLDAALQALLQSELCQMYCRYLPMNLILPMLETFTPTWFTTCLSFGSHVTSLASTSPEDDNTTTPDDGNGTVVDVIWQELPVSPVNLLVCQICAEHAICRDSDILGPESPIFLVCTKGGCCEVPSYETTSDSPPADPHGLPLDWSVNHTETSIDTTTSSQATEVPHINDVMPDTSMS